MRILFLTSMQTGSLGFTFASSMTQLGHKVYCCDYLRIINVYGIAYFYSILSRIHKEYDIVFVLKGHGINPEVITDCPKILYYPDTVERFKDEILYEKYDKTFMCDVNLPNDAVYVPVGVDPHYNPMCKIWNPTKRIVFPATGRDDRIEWVEKLYKRYGLEVYGNNWKQDEPYWKGKPLYNQDLTDLSSKSLWMFNLITGEAINSRVFETLLIGGAVLISQYNETISKVFSDKKHLYLFRNTEELYRILDNPPSIEEMNKVREAGQKEVIEKHLMIHRMKYMIEECEKLL